MKKILFVVLAIVLFNCPTSNANEALYITIENIGSRDIVYVDMGFDMKPYQSGFDFQIFSLLRPNPTNYLLQIDWAHPISVGEVYTTPTIPELSGVDFNFEHLSFSGNGIASTSSGHLADNVVPGVSTYTEYNPDTDFGVKIAFQVVPEPISSILFITGGTILGLRRYIRRKTCQN